MKEWAAVAEQIRKDKEAERATLGIKDKPQKMAQVINLVPKFAAVADDSGHDYFAFTPVFSVCEKHGRYQENALIDGVERWAADGCQKCKKEAQAAQLLRARDSKLQSSNLPKRFAGCEFDNYEADASDKAKAVRVCQRYADNFTSVIESGTNLILRGNVGTGKNHLSTAIAKSVMADGYTVLRVKAGQFLTEFWAREFIERQRWLESVCNIDLLIVDELGRSSDSKAANNAFFALIDGRYENVKPTIVLTNLDAPEIEAELGKAAADRLNGNSYTVEFNWESYRSKAKPRSGQGQKAQGDF